MKTYQISYSYDIKDRGTDEIVYWKRDGFPLELKKGEDIDTSLIKAKVRQMAETKANEFPHAFVSHANYYNISEIKKKK